MAPATDETLWRDGQSRIENGRWIADTNATVQFTADSNRTLTLRGGFVRRRSD
jgi:hypothetical protein